MEIVLSKNVKHLSGSLGQGFGYFISPQKDSDGNLRFFSQRSAHGAPKDGHIRFIIACAELALMGTHITDIGVFVDELDDAIMEATDNKMCSPYCNDDRKLNAKEVLLIKEIFRIWMNH